MVGDVLDEYADEIRGLFTESKTDNKFVSGRILLLPWSPVFFLHLQYYDSGFYQVRGLSRWPCCNARPNPNDIILAGDKHLT